MKKNPLPESGLETQAAPDSWAAFHVERRGFSNLKRDARNARTHSPEQVRQIALAMREWGWTYPILVDEEDLILAGHGRLAAAELNRAELPDDPRWAAAEAPVIVARGWTEAQKRAYALADNQLALNASWAEDVLRFELGELHGMGFDIGLAGFELASLDPPPEGREGPNLGSLAEAFGVPPFSVLNAREGWWQDRKRGWIGLGIQSELGRGEDGTEAHAIEAAKLGDTSGSDHGLASAVADRARARKANAVPGGSRWPTVNPATGRIARAGSKGQLIPGTDAKRDVTTGGLGGEV